MSDVRLPDNISLYVLRLQTADDSDLFASVGADAMLHGVGLLEGEVVKAETVASAARGSGRKCVDLKSVVVQTDPGLLAERFTMEIIVEGVDAFAASARQSSPEACQHARALLDQEAGSASFPALASDTMTLIERVSTDTARQAAATASDAATLLRSVADAQLGPAAQQAISGELQRARTAHAKRSRERDAHHRAGRIDRARGVADAQLEWRVAREMSLQQIEQRGTQQADDHMATANEAVADADAGLDYTAASRRRTGIFSRVAPSIWSFLFTDDAPAADTPPQTDSNIITELRLYIRARLIANAASQLRVAISAFGGTMPLDDDEVERALTPVRVLGDAARQALAEIDQHCQERQRRMSGVFIPAVAAFRDPLRHEAVRLAGNALADRVIREPLAARLATGRALDEEALEDDVLAAARSLTAPARNMALVHLIDQLPAAEVDTLAKLLVSTEPSIEFRSGHPAPIVRRRVAVPGGTRGRLGRAIRRRFTDIDVMPSNEPLLALGVAVTEPFSVDQIEPFHTRWRAAREAARRDGTDRRLVSDRRLLEVGDGITTNRQLDVLVIKAVACGCLAPSKEPPASATVGGTWYLMPPGQLQKPSAVDAARLDTVFNGYRLGRTLPEMRVALRHAPHHRDLVGDQWETWCQRERLEERIARLETLMNTVALPSDELVPMCRELKNTLHRELRALRFEVA